MAEKTSKKNRTLTIRLTDYEKNTVVAKANRCNMSVTKFVLSRLIIDFTQNDEYVKAMRCLKKLSDMLVEISKESKETYILNDFQDILDLQLELKNEMIEIASLA